MDWQLHLKEIHHKLGSGTFTTKNNLGEFSTLTAEPNVALREKTVQALAVAPVANISSSAGLGKSSLKRRKTADENSDETNKETSVIHKKSRMTEDVVSKKVGLASVLAKMQSYQLPLPVQNTPVTEQSLSSKISSMSRESSQSPPPPPPPPPSPPHTIETTNLTQMPTSLEVTSTNGQFLPPVTVNLESLSSKKLYINEMYSGGFSPEDIQRVFKKIYNIDLSSEVIQSVITEYKGSTPLETPSHPLSSTAVVTRPRSRSSSTTPSSILGIKHESPLHESLHESPLVTQTSNIFIPLDDLSTEQSLAALESLQFSLPGKIEQLRLKLQEEKFDKERLRREEDDEIVKKYVAEIKRKLDELDKMKRGDALDMLNKEIEQKRLGWVSYYLTDPD